MSAVLAVAVIAGAASRPQQAQQEPPPQFRAEVSAVLVDVLVLDQQGQPVTGLTAEDFEVYEDKVLQKVSNFDVIDWSSYVARQVPSEDAPISTPASDATANTFPRRFIFIINRSNAKFRDIVRAKKALETFVVESMADGDEAAILDMGLSTKVIQEFTDSKQGTIQSIRKISSMEEDFYRGTGASQDLGTRNVYDTLESLGQSLAQIPGRKVIIFMSPELLQATFLLNYLQDTVDAFNQSNTTVYSIDLRTGPPDFADASIGSGTGLADLATPGGAFVTSISSADAFAIGGLFPLANETGGRYFYNLTSYEPVLRRIGEENRRYYLLTYTPTNLELDGKFRNIEVKVKRPDVEVVARRGYFARKETRTKEAKADEDARPSEPDSTAGKTAESASTPATPATSGTEPARDLTPSGPRPPDSVEITTYLFPKAEGRVEVPIVVALPLDLLTSDGGQGAGHTLRLTIGENEQKTLESFTKAVDPQNFFAVWNPRLMPGVYLLRLTVEASGEHLYQASTAIEVPAGFGKRFGFSSVVPAFPPPSDGSGGIALRPTATFRKGENALVFFRVFAGEDHTVTEDDTKLTYSIYREDREVVSREHPQALRLTGAGDEGAPVVMSLPTSDLPRGNYRVVLRISSPSLGRRASTEFELGIN
jgi:VWFA-related protein